MYSDEGLKGNMEEEVVVLNSMYNFEENNHFLLYQTRTHNRL